MRRVTVVSAAAAAVLAACGGDSSPRRQLQAGWRWVAGMTCADGSPTGIGISPGTTDAVLVYLSGGGACWDASTCASPYLLRAFGQTEYELGQAYVGGTVLDRDVVGNPFASWTMVFIPYCTGDVHAGDSVQTYGTVEWRHHGYENLRAAVRQIATELAPPARVVVSGSSAGGFGALVAYDLVRAEWDPAAVEGGLVDDSGPTFVGSAMPEAIRSAWWDAWSLGSTLSATCSGCRDDLSLVWDHLSTAYPDDRLGLVATTGDLTMRGYFGMSATDYEAAVQGLAAKLSGLAPHAASFRMNGTAHALLFNGSSVDTFATSSGTALLAWLDPVATGTGSFASAGP